MTAQERFWRRVNKTDSCWLWTGTKNSAGYGRLVVGGIKKAAHRYSYELHNGPVPEGLFVCHHCDVKPCVNPAHLYAGTHADNMRDASERGLLSVPKVQHKQCRRGHVYDLLNSNWYNGYPQCRLCRRERKAASRASSSGRAA